jgi:hypothetical protein
MLVGIFFYLYLFLPFGFFISAFFGIIFKLDCSLVGTGFSVVFWVDRLGGGFETAGHFNYSSSWTK